MHLYQLPVFVTSLGSGLAENPSIEAHDKIHHGGSCVVPGRNIDYTDAHAGL
jgi:hypothetical protein